VSRRRWIVRVVVVAVLFAAAWLGRAAWLPAVGRGLNVGEAPRRADYALLLAGEPQTRPLAVALLYKHGYVKKILLTQPVRHPHALIAGFEYPEFTRRMLRHYGVPDEAVEVLPPEVASTYDEAVAAAPRLREHPQATCVVVTSDYHTRRGLWTLRRVVPEAAERVFAFAAPCDDVSADDWWQTEYGLSTYLREYLRLLFYYFRYGDALWIAAAVGVLSVAVRRAWKRSRATPHVLPDRGGS
jgi:uncharacterized SAM-binding protein YcdF (DUF218 family)